jgi:two-component system, NarL family, sensor kinase
VTGPGADGPSSTSLVRRMLEVMATERDLGGILQRAAELVTKTTGCDVCFVHLLDDSRSRLTLAGATPPFDAFIGSVQLAIGEGVAGWVAEHAKPAVVEDKWSDPRYRYIPELRGEDYTTMVSVPMTRRQGGVVGVVNVHSRLRRRFDDEEVALLCDVAGLLATMVENSRLYSRLAEREEELEQFAAKVIEAEEAERRRLAGEIHDGISQPLVGLWFHLQAAADALSRHPETARGELEAAKELTAAALDETRLAIGGLRPALLDDLGLAASLEGLARGLGDVELETDVEACHMAPHVETALFRIAQEAVQNVVKHANASRVRISLRRGEPVADGRETVTLVVSDDGSGFDAVEVAARGNTPNYGLSGMRERAELVQGTFQISAVPGRGTHLMVTVPADR